MLTFILAIAGNCRPLDATTALRVPARIFITGTMPMHACLQPSVRGLVYQTCRNAQLTGSANASVTASTPLQFQINIRHDYRS
jgi:hypothetical protein